MAQVDVNKLITDIEDQEAEAIKSIKVEKEVDLDFDIGHLSAFDKNIIDVKEFRSAEEKALTRISRDNTQLVINQLWNLETMNKDGLVIVKLPKVNVILPRAKPAPKPKAVTKWEAYAKEKGIQKRKKEKLVWDELTKEWKPTYGYRRAENDKTDWVMPIPDHNKDPNVDMYEGKKEAKKERVAKNEYKRLRNVARGQKIKVGGMKGILPTPDQSREEIAHTASLVKTSTASLGKFEKVFSDEKPMKDSGKKRKFDSNFQSNECEKEQQMQIFEKIQKRAPKLDVDKAANSLAPAEKKERDRKKGNPKKSGKKPRGKEFKKGKKFAKNMGEKKGMGGNKFGAGKRNRK